MRFTLDRYYVGCSFDHGVFVIDQRRDTSVTCSMIVCMLRVEGVGLAGCKLGNRYVSGLKFGRTIDRGRRAASTSTSDLASVGHFV